MGMLFQRDCIELMGKMRDKCVDFTITDIPYGEVTRDSRMKVLDKGIADIVTFELSDFLSEGLRVTRNSLVIFCGWRQISDIISFLGRQKGTVRPIVWEKTNASPMNGQHMYLSGVEFGVWFKFSGAKVFNAWCKNTVFRYPTGSSRLHPTEKNHSLITELIADNTNVGDIVFDPCMGSAAHLMVANRMSRRFVGCEKNAAFFRAAKSRMEKEPRSLLLCGSDLRPESIFRDAPNFEPVL